LEVQQGQIFLDNPFQVDYEPLLAKEGVDIEKRAITPTKEERTE
jgi:hypothetical protein